ncbi:MAG TPA: MoaD/ThiS family protein [Anaerolineales bacterium]|nr:MoaD/ThiS family protein [Anaerolineales bacterium]
MRIHVRLAEPFWRTVGQRDLELELEDSAAISDLLAVLQGRFPALVEEMAQAQPHFFIDEQESGPETPLQDGARLHIVWPVAGG